MIDKIALLVSHGLLLLLFLLTYPVPELDTEDPEELAKSRVRRHKQQAPRDA